MTVDPVVVAHCIDHLAGQLRRGRSAHRALIRVDADALGIVLDEVDRLRVAIRTTPSPGVPAPVGPTRKA